MKLTFLIPLAGLSSGILLSSEWFPGFTFPLICFGLGFLLWCVIRFHANNPIKLHNYRYYHFLWIFLLFAGAGGIDFEINSRTEIPSTLDGNLVKIAGDIYENRTLAKGDIFKINILSLKDENDNTIHSRNAALLVKTNGFSAKNGEKIAFIGRLHKFQFSNHYLKRYSETLKREGIEYYVDLKSDQITKTGRPLSLSSLTEDIKDFLIIQLEKAKLQKNCKQFIICLLLGDKSHISTGQREILTNAGLGHMLALSGLHIGIILGIFMFSLIPLSFLGKNILRKFLAILLVWLYVFITGGAPSTVRAALMASFIMLAIILQRKNSSLNALFAATLIILIFQPSALWNIGLQLSFISVASILLFVSKLNTIDKHKHHCVYNILSILLVSIVATFSTWILTAFYFNSVPLLFIPANLLLLPLLPFFIGGALIYLFLLCLQIDFTLLAHGLEFFADLFFKGAHTLSGDGASVLNVNVTPLSLVLWLGALIMMGVGLYSYSNTKKIIFTCSSVGIFSSAVFLLFLTGSQDQTNYIRFPHSFTNMEAHIIDGETIHKMRFERNHVSTADYGNLKLIVVDGIINTDNLYLLKECERDKRNVLYIGPGAQFDQISQIDQDLNFEKIILHPGLGKVMKTQLAEKLSEETLDRIYSLGEKGSLEFSL